MEASKDNFLLDLRMTTTQAQLFCEVFVSKLLHTASLTHIWIVFHLVVTMKRSLDYHLIPLQYLYGSAFLLTYI